MSRYGALLFALALAVFAPPAQAEIKIVPVTSPGGVEAWLYEDHTIPILTISASFLGGATSDPQGREGATIFMAALLEEGAGELDATAFATTREALASPMSFGASGDEVQVSAAMLTEARDETVELLRLALTEPRFDSEAVERLRGQVLASIRMRQSDPRAVPDQSASYPAAAK
jgi:zinc protease